MEFTPDLSAFQGILISADNVHSFSRISARGGNEEKIDYIIDTIYNFLEREKCMSENALVRDKKEKLRQFALYLVLNADLPELDKMVDIEGIHMAIWTVPTISKCLLSEMLWNLHMDKFVYEIIAFCNPQLALDLASTLTVNLNYFSPSTCLEKVKTLTAACYRLITRLHFFNFENRVLCNILTTAYNTFLQCLSYFITPPNAGKLDCLSKDDQYEYKGRCLHTILSLIYECLELHSHTQEFRASNFNEMYLLTFEVETLPANSSTIRTQDVLECLDKCHLTLLDKCQELVMDISVDIFCAWSEFKDNEKSMQKTIGELCYKLREILITISTLSEHPVVAMIQQISCKPVTIEDIVNLVDSKTIIENISTNNNRDAWIRALLHKDDLCNDQNLVEHLASNLDVLNSDECYILYKVCQNYLNDDTKNYNSLELLVTRLFQHCEDKAKYEILEERFSNNYFFDMSETTEFNNTMTELFNKLISSPDSKLSDVLNVFVQSPQKVYLKIYLLATESAQQTEIMIRVMQLLEKYSNHYYRHETEPSMIGNIKQILDNYLDTEIKQQNIVKFLCGLKSVKLISGTKLLLLIVMPNLHKGLVNKDTCRINIQCKLLSEAYTLDELQEYRAPMLAMLAQVLEVLRWKFDTFTASGPNILTLALQLQKLLFNTYDAGIPDKEANWLRAKLKNMRPLNCYYYRKLWKQSEENFVETVSGMSISREMDITPIVAWLSLVICSSTQKELCSIWDDLSIFEDTIVLDIFYKVLMLVTKIEARDRTNNTWGCLLNCYRNFIFVIRYKFFKEPLTDSQVSTVINKIALLVNLMDEENVQDIETTLLPLFSYIVQRRKEYTVDVPHLYLGIGALGGPDVILGMTPLSLQVKKRAMEQWFKMKSLNLWKGNFMDKGHTKVASPYEDNLSLIMANNDLIKKQKIFDKKYRVHIH